MYYSVFDDALKLGKDENSLDKDKDKDNLVVSFLMADDEYHAILLIEGVSNKKYYIRVMDLLPNEGDYYNNGYIIWTVLKNDNMSGKIRNHREPFEVAPRDLDDFMAKYTEIRNTRKNQPVSEILPRFSTAKSVRPRLITKEQERALLTAVTDDEVAFRIGSKKFNINGKTANNSNAHNCTTWALEKLSGIDIELEQKINFYSSAKPPNAGNVIGNSQNGIRRR